ncbi:MAG: metallophosphoesterase [Pseudomonadota bacterium]
MTDFRMVLLSDTHISRTHPLFFHNFDVAVEAANALQPDVAIVTGDLSLNGPDAPADLDFAADQMQRFAAPVIKVTPGNHDLGYSPAATHAEQHMTTERRQEYLTRVGADFWHFDHGNWRFVGLNPFLFESGFAAEAEQRAMVVDALTHDGPIGVFTHVPFFANDPGESDPATSATVTPGPRADYLHLFKGADVRFVASGHLHKDKRMIIDGITHIWAPGVAFMQSGHDAFGGQPWVGFLEFNFSGDVYSVQMHEPEDMINMDLRNWTRGEGHRYFRVVEQPFRDPK